MTKLPWFQFYPSDWLSNSKIALLSPAEEGGFIRLLCHCWNDPNCSLPNSDEDLAALSRLGDQWSKGSGVKLWALFVRHPSKRGRLTEPDLYKEFVRLQGRSLERSASGMKGAKRRWSPESKQTNTLDDGSAIGSAIQEPMANDGELYIATYILPHDSSILMTGHP
jgi:hypothetical protein